MSLIEKMASKANESEENKKLVSLMEERIEQGKNQISNPQNYINMAYYLGKQWIHWDAVNKRVFEASKEEGRTHFVANRIQKIVRTELAKIQKNKPIMSCIPATTEEEDIRASKTGDKVLDYLEYKHQLQTDVDKKVIMWGLTTEFGVVHPYWDVSAGKTIVHPEDPSKVVRTGEEKIDILSPFDLIIDPDAKSWSEVTWVIKPKVRKVKYIKDMYGVDVTPDEKIECNGMAAQLDGLYQKYGTEKPKKSKDNVTLYECWEAPSKEYPNGRRWAMAGGVYLYSIPDIGFGEEDKTDRELPFFLFTNIEVPGRIQGMSMVEVLSPIQREYNRTRSQIIDNKDLMSNPAWLAEDGAVDDENDLTNAVGSVIVYNKGFARPERDQPPSMGADVYKNLEQLVEEFYFISGQQEVSHGSTPTGVTSGVAISYLQEQDDTVIAPTISNFIKCKRGYMSYLLKMLKFKYDYPRTLKIVGKNNEVSMLEFKGSDLTSTDVQIEEASMFQTTKAGKQNWIMNLINAGVLDPIQNQDKILRMLELGITDDLFEQTQIDIDQAKKEQLLWEKGDLDNTIVRDFYNHAVHIAEHDRFRKSDIYDGMEPQNQAQIDRHVFEHQVYLTQNSVLENTAAMPIQEGGENNDGSVSKLPSGAESKGSTETQTGK